MRDPYANEAANRRFNALIAVLPKREVVIGHTHDGDALTIEVPTAVTR